MDGIANFFILSYRHSGLGCQLRRTIYRCLANHCCCFESFIRMQLLRAGTNALPWRREVPILERGYQAYAILNLAKYLR